MKQVIVMRKDLNMRKGKLVAQGAHASMATLNQFLDKEMPYEMKTWLEGKFTKICVYVNSEEELLEIYDKAKKADLICSLIKDSGLTEFHGVPTLTCTAIGPALPEDIDKITGELKLL